MWHFQGITYDTGGADIKAGGVMAGMHRDKCGAAAVAGFFQVNEPLNQNNKTVSVDQESELLVWLSDYKKSTNELIFAD